MATMNDGGSYEVFDIAGWLDRANGRSGGPSSGESPTQGSMQGSTQGSSYVPRHRADLPVDHVA